jgi:hypothetical protein
MPRPPVDFATSGPTIDPDFTYSAARTIFFLRHYQYYNNYNTMITVRQA